MPRFHTFVRQAYEYDSSVLSVRARNGITTPDAFRGANEPTAYAST